MRGTKACIGTTLLRLQRVNERDLAVRVSGEQQLVLGRLVGTCHFLLPLEARNLSNLDDLPQLQALLLLGV